MFEIDFQNANLPRPATIFNKIMARQGIEPKVRFPLLVLDRNRFAPILRKINQNNNNVQSVNCMDCPTKSLISEYLRLYNLLW